VPLLPGRPDHSGRRFGILALQNRGYRTFEIAIVALLCRDPVRFLYQTFVAEAISTKLLSGFVPGFSGSDSILLATGILGATVIAARDLSALGADPGPHPHRATMPRSTSCCASSASTC